MEDFVDKKDEVRDEELKYFKNRLRLRFCEDWKRIRVLFRSFDDIEWKYRGRFRFRLLEINNGFYEDVDVVEDNDDNMKEERRGRFRLLEIKYRFFRRNEVDDDKKIGLCRRRLRFKLVEGKCSYYIKEI